MPQMGYLESKNNLQIPRLVEGDQATLIIKDGDLEVLKIEPVEIIDVSRHDDGMDTRVQKDLSGALVSQDLAKRLCGYDHNRAIKIKGLASVRECGHAAHFERILLS